MSDAIIRRARAQDEPALKALWNLAFGDERRLIEAFFALFFTPERCLVAELDGKVRAAAYMLPDLRLCDGRGGALPAVYFYALATHPSDRGRGLGAGVTRGCIELARERGEALCLFPADEDLRVWYARTSGLADLGRACVLCTNPKLVGAAPACRIRTLSPTDYAARRERLLAQRPHAALPESFFRFQTHICECIGGGGLLELEIDGVQGLACVEMQRGSLSAKELLFDGAPETAAAALMAHFDANGCTLHLPADKTQGARTVMADGDFARMNDLWWGPMLD